MFKRDIPEINGFNGGHCLPIVVILFATTTMDKDQAYLRDIPQKIDVPPEDIEIQERNIFENRS